MTAGERWRLAVHEAAHAYARWLSGWPLAVVSIRPGAAHAGVTIHDRHPDYGRLRDLIGEHRPLDGLDPEAWQWATRAMVATAIGDVAADLFCPGIGRTLVPPETPVSVTPREVAPSAAARLAISEANPDPLDDAAILWEMAYALLGPTTNAYIPWVKAEAGQVATAGATPIHALAGPLVAREVIDGREAVAIFEAARKEHP